MVTEQDLQNQRDLLETKRRLAEVERALKALQDDQSGGVRSRLETLARNQADLQAGLDNLRVDMQALRGASDDQLRSQDDLRQEMALVRDELTLRIADLEQRLAQLAAGPSPTEPAPAPEPPPAPTAQPTPAVSPTPATETAERLYDRALTMIREVRDFQGGRELMETFLKRYPNDPLAVNAAYWVGETYYAEKAYDQAVLKFEDVIQNYGDHPKVASALLKQGLAFDALGDRANARLLLETVTRRFPNVDEAKIAREKLAEWGR